MTTTDLVWWLVGTRAVIGTSLLVVSLRMRHLCVVDRIELRALGVNGMIQEILTGQVRYATLRSFVIGVFTLTAWLSWPHVIARGPYGAPAVWVSSLFLLAVFVEGWIGVLKYRERVRLMDMARAKVAEARL